MTYLSNSSVEIRRITDEGGTVAVSGCEIVLNIGEMRESGEMEDTESRREENERGRGGETGMYHLVHKIGGVYSLIASWVLEPV